MVTALVLASVVIVAAIAVVRAVRRRARIRVEASLVASDLIPEIRAILDTTRSGETVPASRFALARQQLPRLFREETLFAVETFYQCVEAYRDAAGAMVEVFDGESATSLGDRIRAKDRRDRCLKDVYYTGEAAIERLSNLGELPAK
jgi:hypothetical protein